MIRRQEIPLHQNSGLHGSCAPIETAGIETFCRSTRRARRRLCYRPVRLFFPHPPLRKASLPAKFPSHKISRSSLLIPFPISDTPKTSASRLAAQRRSRAATFDLFLESGIINVLVDKNLISSPTWDALPDRLKKWHCRRRFRMDIFRQDGSQKNAPLIIRQHSGRCA